MKENTAQDELDALFGFGSQPGFVQWDFREPDLASQRLTISADALFSAEQVVRMLGGRAAEVRRWLREVRPLRHPSGRRVYLWRDVLDHLRKAA